ncbi:MAG TPA: glycosyltransferase family 87 protein [Ktedonobacterales bacterium]|nr:glycosyltransferase family 87 protein [Ktedonobacterales bacterium]
MKPSPALLARLGWAALLGVGVAALVWLVAQSSQAGTDFCQDYLAAQRALRSEQPYFLLFSSSGQSLCPGISLYDAHPPFTILLFLPFALGSQAGGALLWGLVSLAAYLLSGLLIVRELRWRLLRGMALFVVGSLVWTPALLAIGSHNLGQAVTALLIGAWVLGRRQRGGWAGVLLGLAALVKIWPIALLLHALLWRKWREALTGALTVLAGLLVSLVVLHPAAYAVYLGPVQAEERTAAPSYSNTSLVGAVARLFLGYPAQPQPLPPLIAGVGLARAVLLAEAVGGVLLAATLAFMWWRGRLVKPDVGELLSLGLLVVALLLTFPVTWYWGLITLLLPAATLWLALRHLPSPPRWWWAALGVSLILLLIPGGLLLALPGWLQAQDAHLGGLANLLTWLPTCALLLFAGTQAQLLWWASRPETAADLTPSSC